MDLKSGDRKELETNYFDYEDQIMELLDLFHKNQEMRERKNFLHSQMARFNFDIYDTWMELHKNAITLSSYRAEVNLRSIDLEESFRKDVDSIIEKYVLMEKFS